MCKQSTVPCGGGQRGSIRTAGASSSPGAPLARPTLGVGLATSGVGSTAEIDNRQLVNSQSELEEQSTGQRGAVEWCGTHLKIRAPPLTIGI